jgi:hypothetical protein
MFTRVLRFKSILSTFLLVTLSFGLLLSASAEYTVEEGFWDVVNTHQYYLPISYFGEVGVFTGNPDGSFGPEDISNRAAALTTIYRVSSIDPVSDGAGASYSDVASDAWYYSYVMDASANGVVGGNPDGTFAPGDAVSLAAYLKMLLNQYGIKQEALDTVTNEAPDVQIGEWYHSYVMYAANMGLILPDVNGNYNPGASLTRGKMAEISYLLTLILAQNDPQFLVDRSSAHMTQIAVYVDDANVYSAKDSSELAVDLSMQAYTLLPDNTVILGVAKLAKAWDYAMDSFLYALSEDNTNAELWANSAIDKATEAWAVDPTNVEVQATASTIKAVSRSILEQVGGTEWGE